MVLHEIWEPVCTDQTWSWFDEHATAASQDRAGRVGFAVAGVGFATAALTLAFRDGGTAFLVVFVTMGLMLGVAAWGARGGVVRRLEFGERVLTLTRHPIRIELEDGEFTAGPSKRLSVGDHGVRTLGTAVHIAYADLDRVLVLDETIVLIGANDDVELRPTSLEPALRRALAEAIHARARGDRASMDGAARTAAERLGPRARQDVGGSTGRR
jgi:hypothetical protein